MFKFILSFALIGSAFAQYPLRDPHWEVVGVGVNASKPATCRTQRDVYICTDCAAGANLLYCDPTHSTPNEFVPQGSSNGTLDPSLNALAGAYYVDSVNGSDSNNGFTPNTAFLTIAHLVATDNVTPKDRWRLMRGSHFREALNVPRDNMTIEAWGDGAMPILDASDTISAGSWSKTAGLTNVYQATITFDAVAGKSMCSVWENNTRLVRKTSTATVDSTAGSYMCADENTSPTTIYVHATDNSNPGTSGKTYEYANRGYGLSTYDVRGSLVRGIKTMRNSRNDGSLWIGVDDTATDMLAYEGSVHNVIVRPGAHLKNVTAQYAYSPVTNLSMFVYNEDSPSGGDVVFENCSAIQTGATGGNDVGFDGHRNVSGTFGTIYYINSTASGLDYGFNGQHAAMIHLEKVTTSNITQGAVLVSSPTEIIDSILVATDKVVVLSSAGVSATITHSHLTAEAGGGAIGIYSFQPNTSVTITDTSIQSNAAAVQFTSTGNTLTSTQNDFTHAYGTVYQFDSQTMSGTSDSNKLAPGQTFVDNGVSKTFAQWQGLGHDTSSATFTQQTAANLTSAAALPNGTTATTQSQSDNSDKLATTAFVHGLSFWGSGTVASMLASSPTTGSLWLATDALNTRDCDTGGGSGSIAWCYYNGSSWIAMSSSGSTNLTRGSTEPPPGGCTSWPTMDVYQVTVNGHLWACTTDGTWFLYLMTDGSGPLSLTAQNSVSPPATPVAGKSTLFFTTDKVGGVIDDAGNVSTTVRGGSAVANQVVTNIGTDGSVTRAALTGSYLPVPGASSLGGAKSKTCSTGDFFNSLDTTGAFTCGTPSGGGGGGGGGGSSQLDYQKAATDVTTSGATETTLYTTTLGAGALTSGGCIQVQSGYTRASSTDSITYKLYYGTASISYASTNGSRQSMKALICNDPSSTSSQQLAITLLDLSAATQVPAVSTGAIDSTASQVVKLTVTSAGSNVTFNRLWWQISAFTGGSGGGASSFAQLTDCLPSIASNVVTIPQTCQVENWGGRFTTPTAATFTWSANDGTATLTYYQNAIHVYTSGVTGTCGGGATCAATSVPDDAVVLGTFTWSAGVATQTESRAEMRVFKTTVTGAGVTGAVSNGVQNYDITPQYSGVRAISGTSDTLTVSMCQGVQRYTSTSSIAVTLTNTSIVAGCWMDLFGTATTGAITVTPSSGQINGGSNTVISSGTKFTRMYFDGTNWFTN